MLKQPPPPVGLSRVAGRIVGGWSARSVQPHVATGWMIAVRLQRRPQPGVGSTGGVEEGPEQRARDRDVETVLAKRARQQRFRERDALRRQRRGRVGGDVHGSSGRTPGHTTNPSAGASPTSGTSSGGSGSTSSRKSNVASGVT